MSLAVHTQLRLVGFLNRKKSLTKSDLNRNNTLNRHPCKYIYINNFLKLITNVYLLTIYFWLVKCNIAVNQSLSTETQSQHKTSKTENSWNSQLIIMTAVNLILCQCPPECQSFARQVQPASLQLLLCYVPTSWPSWDRLEETRTSLQ